jgi:1-acyl-sn-glycerol-3-phosphate acyltransferase
MTWLGNLWYDANYWAMMAALTLGWSLRIEGRRHVPRRGPVLLLANHQSFLDPPIVGVASPRRVWFLARRTLFQPPLGALLRSYHGVPVNLEGLARDGLQAVLDLLKIGEAVVVYPEGNRTEDGAMQPLMPGVHLLIRRSGPFTIVPVGIAGAFEALSRHRKFPRFSPMVSPATGAGLAVVLGKPVASEPYKEMDRDKVLADLLERIRHVQQRAERIRRNPNRPR